MTWRRPARDSSKFKPNTLTIQAIASGESGGRGQRRCHLQGNLRDQCYTYQGSLGTLHVYMGRSWVPTRGLWAPRPRAGARAPGPGPKGRIRQGPIGARPLAGAHGFANVVSVTQTTFKKSGNAQLFVDLKSFIFVLQPSLCPGLMCVGTLGLGNRRAREP